MFASPSSRIFPAAGAMSLAALLVLNGVASATALPSLSYSLSGDTLTATVTGDARTGVWRVRLVAPSAERRIDLVLRKGDIAWSGVVRVSRKLGNSWTLVSRRSLDDALMTGTSSAGCNAGVCWDTAKFRTPRNGDARFAVTVQLSQAGTYRLVGAVREASEAFIYGSWLRSSAQVVPH